MERPADNCHTGVCITDPGLELIKREAKIEKMRTACVLQGHSVCALWVTVPFYSKSEYGVYLFN